MSRVLAVFLACTVAGASKVVIQRSRFLHGSSQQNRYPGSQILAWGTHDSQQHAFQWRDGGLDPSLHRLRDAMVLGIGVENNEAAAFAKIRRDAAAVAEKEQLHEKLEEIYPQKDMIENNLEDALDGLSGALASVTGTKQNGLGLGKNGTKGTNASTGTSTSKSYFVDQVIQDDATFHKDYISDDDGPEDAWWKKEGAQAREGEGSFSAEAVAGAGAGAGEEAGAGARASAGDKAAAGAGAQAEAGTGFSVGAKAEAEAGAAAGAGEEAGAGARAAAGDKAEVEAEAGAGAGVTAGITAEEANTRSGAGDAEAVQGQEQVAHDDDREEMEPLIGDMLPDVHGYGEPEPMPMPVKIPTRDLAAEMP